jgi:hypothetical protein|tara:strand:- start:1270 stop:1662 length:393 start_codon:yes stop_codon:yes gene_type:complete
MKNWKEKDLFEWLSKNYYKELVNSNNPISRWDCYDLDKCHRVELKCRRKHYNTLILEKSKYDAIIYESLKHLDIPIYINSTPKGVYLFNLNKIQPNWFEKSLPATTEFKNRIWVKKIITELELSQSIKIK